MSSGLGALGAALLAMGLAVFLERLALFLAVAFGPLPAAQELLEARLGRAGNEPLFSTLEELERWEDFTRGR